MGNLNIQKQLGNNILNPSFKQICDNDINTLSQENFAKYYNSLERGRAIPSFFEQLPLYNACYSEMHIHKLNLAYDTLFAKEELNGKIAEIIDWGCGQAFASGVLIDYVKNNNISLDLSKFILIEPSEIALKRGLLHIETIYHRIPRPRIFIYNNKADATLNFKQFIEKDRIKIHLFSNVLDITTLDLNKLFENIARNFEGINYFVCVSPLNEYKLKEFYKMFNNGKLLSVKNDMIQREIFSPLQMKRIPFSISRVEYIFKTNI